MTLTLQLKPGRDIPIIRGHPWIMSGAIAHAKGPAQDDEADILAADGAFVGRATVHPSSEIRARVFAAVPGERLDDAGIRARLAAAIDRRQRWVSAGADGGVRLVFSESDGLPGLIVDRYADVVVFQLLTAPWEIRRETLIAALVDQLHPRTVWERSDADVRKHEGLTPRKGLAWGQPVTGPVPFKENVWRFLADVENGHKTGFYLDQRANRQKLATWVRRLGKPRLLNVFAYTDSMGICALQAGAAHIVSVDSSTAARDLAGAQHGQNPDSASTVRDYRLGDAFEILRALRSENARFDVIVLDPPRLVPRRDKMKQGLRAYKDLNLQACHLVNAGGLLFTLSCSGLVERELFAKVIEGAARDARRPIQFLDDLGQPPDHPRKPNFPESEYLKGFVVGF